MSDHVLSTPSAARIHEATGSVGDLLPLPQGTKYISHILSNGFCPFEYTRFYEINAMMMQSQPNFETYIRQLPMFSSTPNIFFGDNFGAKSSKYVKHEPVTSKIWPGKTVTEYKSELMMDKKYCGLTTNLNRNLTNDESFGSTLSTDEANKSVESLTSAICTEVNDHLRQTLIQLKKQLYKVTSDWMEELMKTNVPSKRSASVEHLKNVGFSLPPSTTTIRRTVSEKNLNKLFLSPAIGINFPSKIDDEFFGFNDVCMRESVCILSVVDS